MESLKASRRTILSVAKLLFLALSNVPLIRGAPTKLLQTFVEGVQDEPEPLPADDASLWVYLSVAVGLVLLGGAFAGLTIALMGQVNASVAQNLPYLLTHTYRMKSIYKSSKHPAKVQRRSMQPRSCGCSKRENTGSWSHCFWVMSLQTRRFL